MIIKILLISIKKVFQKKIKILKTKGRMFLKLIIYKNILINLEEFYEFSQINKFILI